MDKNNLAAEVSPYLLQHKDNPVAWQAWGENPFKLAAEANRPIFLSIGYSTCYWCHVMEQESFEDKEVAQYLNDNFVSIKVDREERPDVDNYYMDAVIALTGQGGWPMSVLLTPDRKPFWAGTYLTKPQFMLLLQRITELWTNNREAIFDSSEKISQALLDKKYELDGDLDLYQLLELGIEDLRESFDFQFGGFGSAPKFPPSQQLTLLMNEFQRSGECVLQEMAEKTLDRMCRGGIYDQIGGGFSRYSTDQKWLVPHFEKMLYDNALMGECYLTGYKLTQEEGYRTIVEEIISYLRRELLTPQGAFISAEDAGEVGKEGEYYLWSYEELKAELKEQELAQVEEIFGVSNEGNFEGKNILTLSDGVELGFRAEEEFNKLSSRMLKLRQKREHPSRDAKVLSAWNGLTVSFLVKAGSILERQDYVELACKTLSFLREELFSDQKLAISYCSDETRGDGCVDDYAFVIRAAIDLFQVTQDRAWLDWAIKLQEIQDLLLWDNQNGGYFFSQASDLPAQKKVIFDGAMPAGNSVSLRNLQYLFAITGEQNYSKRKAELLEFMAPYIDKAPAGITSALQALQIEITGIVQVVLIAEPAAPICKEVKEALRNSKVSNYIFLEYSPSDTENRLLPARGKEQIKASPTIFVCKNNSCKTPVNSVSGMLEQLRKV